MVCVVGEGTIKSHLSHDPLLTSLDELALEPLSTGLSVKHNLNILLTRTMIKTKGRSIKDREIEEAREIAEEINQKAKTTRQADEVKEEENEYEKEYEEKKKKRNK